MALELGNAWGEGSGRVGIDVGQIIDSKYEILALVGRGGTSNIWLGRDVRLDKLWAIKEPRVSGDAVQCAAYRQAVIDEANFIKRLDHPAIPRVVDLIPAGPSVYVAMDYVDGTSLARVLRKQATSFDQQRVVDWGIQLCDALQYLHSLNIVYRDMKPSNVMLRNDDKLRLVDFGIATEIPPSGLFDARVVGTAGYSAPEQVDRDMHGIVPVDARADIYALGMTLYSLVTNQIPRMGLDEETGRPTVDFQLKPLRIWDSRLSVEFGNILETATRRNPNERYQTAAEMRSALERCKECISRDAYAFISYGKADRVHADLIRSLCAEWGILSWMAPYDIPPGGNYPDHIGAAVEGCACLLLLLSADSQRSPFVYREVERAVSCGKRIVALRMGDVSLTSGFRFLLSSTQIADIKGFCRGNPQIASVLDELRMIVWQSKSGNGDTPVDSSQWEGGTFDAGLRYSDDEFPTIIEVPAMN